MSLFSNCSGECCICLSGGGCLVGDGEDFFEPATNEQILERLAKGQFLNYRDTMINELHNRGFDIVMALKRRKE